MADEPKVHFCKDCKYIARFVDRYGNEKDYVCNHEANTTPQNDWFRPGVTYKRSPNKINVNNSCLYWEEGEVKD